MVKSLFNFLKKPKAGTELLTELDITRVVGTSSRPEPQDSVEEDSDKPVDLSSWKQNDLDLLQTCWEACCEAPENEEAVKVFKSALHNLHGASGAYGGGALTRLTGSLQSLVSEIDDVQNAAALVNLHVQACRAAALSDGDAADDVADAVCDALESQVDAQLRA